MPFNQSADPAFRFELGQNSIVASVNETMAALKIGRAKTYELLNSGLLESYLEGSSRKITWRSIEFYIERRLKEEAERRAHNAEAAKHRNRVR
ncbi:DNA-binding protein [Bradyrhizobium sp. B124]|uniref:DNA-binding protein n=1 Tax=Bradyrhizobium sp. B124 TaxID=3140245 RepID=UPI0031838058